MKDKHIERNLWLLVAMMVGFAVMAGNCFGQLDIRKRTVTLDSINARNGAIWINAPSDSIKIGRDSTLLELIQEHGGGVSFFYDSLGYVKLNKDYGAMWFDNNLVGSDPFFTFNCRNTASSISILNSNSSVGGICIDNTSVGMSIKTASSTTPFQVQNLLHQIIMKVRDDGGVVSTKYYVSALNTAPSSATDTGTLGEIRVTATHIYVCVATNTWVRTALTTW